MPKILRILLQLFGFYKKEETVTRQDVNNMPEEKIQGWNDFEARCDEIDGTIIRDREYSNVYNCKLDGKTQFAVIKDKSGNWIEREE